MCNKDTLKESVTILFYHSITIKCTEVLMFICLFIYSSSILV